MLHCNRSCLNGPDGAQPTVTHTVPIKYPATSAAKLLRVRKRVAVWIGAVSKISLALIMAPLRESVQCTHEI